MNIKDILIIFIVLTVVSCGSGNQSGDENKGTEQKAEEAEVHDPMKNKGVGPIKNLVISDEIDLEMAAKGKEVYDLKCTACHKATERFIGPAPKGVLDRRTPEWVMNMILDPEGMIKNDPDAKALLIEYNMAPMANQSITEEEARAMLEYFRTL
jgi:mono/diheme cytochrome c family protein